MNTDTQIVEEAVVTPSKQVADSFNAELEKVGIDPKTGNAKQNGMEEANDVTKTKVEEKVVETKPDESGIPDELLTGKTKVEEVDPFTAEPPPELKGKSREHFKNLQVQSGQKITHLETELAQTKSEIAELKRNGNVPGEDFTKELEALRKDKAEIEAELERAAVERSPKFKKQFAPREQSIKALAVKALKASGADETIFEQAIAASDKRKFEILNSEDLNESQRSALTSLLVQYDMLQNEKESALANSKEYVQQEIAQLQREREEKIAREEAEDNHVFESIGKKVMTEYEPFMEVEGQEDWNQLVRTNKELARNFFAGKATREELAEIAYYGIGAKSLHKMFRNLQGKYNALVASHGKVIASNPSINGSHEVKETPKTESVEQRRMRTFNEELSAVQNQG